MPISGTAGALSPPSRPVAGPLSGVQSKISGRPHTFRCAHGRPWPIALAVAGLSKAAFITLILMHGGQYLSRAGLVVAVDSVWVIVFALYFLDGRRGHGAVTATSRPD